MRVLALSNRLVKLLRILFPVSFPVKLRVKFLTLRVADALT
jgi:hypothetical protein